MSQRQRPSIVPLVLAEFIEAVPTRVRKRLDKEPDAAEHWNWKSADDIWTIATGEETVTMRAQQGKISVADAVQCTCLLSPRCFHILACINCLTPEQASDATGHEPDPKEKEFERPNIKKPIAAAVEVVPEMRTAAERASNELRLLLQVGCRRADLLRQSGLIRAAHGCRAAGLINLANGLLRIVESVRRQRENRDTADAQSAAEGLASALEQTEFMLQQPHVPQAVIGQARRQFFPTDVGKLVGLCAEPILTLSGYAGVVVYLQQADSTSPFVRAEPLSTESLYSVSHVRPGDSQWARQAYRGGIDMGQVSMQAAELCRGQLLVQNLTASTDGRLGKGSTTRWVLTSHTQDFSPFSQGRFGQPLIDQVTLVFDRANETLEERPAGWDLVAFDAEVLGAQGAALIVRLQENSQVWKLRIAIDHPALPFRENLSLLARCRGLQIRCLGRLRLQSAGEVDLLAITNSPEAANSTDAGPEDESASKPARPRLNCNEPWKGICNLGFDRLERHNIEGIQRWSEEVEMGEEREHQRGEYEGSSLDGLESLRRRQVAVALGGRYAVAELSSEAHRRDQRQLRQRHQHTAAELIDLLAIAAHGRESEHAITGTKKGQNSLPLERVYLASHLYVRVASKHFQKQLWLEKVKSK